MRWLRLPEARSCRDAIAVETAWRGQGVRGEEGEGRGEREGGRGERGEEEEGKEQGEGRRRERGKEEGVREGEAGGSEGVRGEGERGERGEEEGGKEEGVREEVL